MTKLKVTNMSCEHCVKRIDEALNKVNIEHQINLSDKTVMLREQA